MLLEELVKRYGNDWKAMAEHCRDKMVETGMIWTPAFGWVSEPEADWLTKKLREVGINEDVTELDYIPTTTARRGRSNARVGYKEGDSFVSVYPFVDKFYEMRRARELAQIARERLAPIS